MSDREAELERLVAEVREHDAVEDAFLAKSFTDRLVIVDVDLAAGDGDKTAVPADVTDRLAAHDVRGADEVYDDGGSFVGHVGNGTRHHFVDVQTRGAHQSYVVD